MTAIVHVVADDKSVRAASAASEHAEPQRFSAPPAFVMGGGVMPAPLLAATLERATLREVRHPGDSPPEPRYVPWRSLADFVRCRDLTCRFPGCDKPAQYCDIDHTVPYPVGPTHASNLKCLCRFHQVQKVLRRNPPLCRGDGEEVPFAGHALELTRAAVFEFES